VNPASGVYRWNVLLLLASSQAIAYIDRVNFAVVAPHLIKVYHYTPAQVGVLLSIFNWAFTVSLLAAGPLTDWIRPRRAYPARVGFWSLATALCSLTMSFAPLAVLRALVGLGESLMIPSGSRVIRETFDKKHRAVAVGTFFAGNRMGLTLGIPLASVVLVNWGWAGSSIPRDRWAFSGSHGGSLYIARRHSIRPNALNPRKPNAESDGRRSSSTARRGA